MDSYDVAVIGAGIHGASAAYHLAQRGARVVVFEKTMPAGGPTGRSSAVVRAYYTNRFLAEVARDSIEIFSHFTELTGGGDCGYRRVGGAFLHSAEDAAQTQTVAAQLAELNVPVELLTGPDVSDLLPEFVLDDVAVVAWEPDAGYADPAGTTTGLCAAAVAGGATLRTQTRVWALRAQPDHVVLESDDGVTLADRVLVAAGPWTRELARQVGVELPLRVERHTVASYAYGAASPVACVIGDIPGGYYLKPEGAAHFQLGALSPAPEADPDAFDQAISPDESLELGAAAIRRVPRLDAATQAGGWASLYDVSPDWQPVIGQIDERVFVDAGTSGHGFKLGPALGRQVAAMLLGDDVHPGLAQFHPARFDQGEMLASGYGDAKILG